MHHLHPCYCGHFVHEATAQTQDWLREVVDWNPQNGSSHPLDYENPPLLRLLLGEHSYGTRYLHAFCSFGKVSPRLLCPQFSNYAPSKSLTIKPNHWPEPIDCYIIARLAVSPSKNSEQPGALLRSLPTGRIPLHHCLRGRPRVELWCYSCPLLGGASMLCRTICKPGSSLLSLCQLIIGNSS